MYRRYLPPLRTLVTCNAIARGRHRVITCTLPTSTYEPPYYSPAILQVASLALLLTQSSLEWILPYKPSFSQVSLVLLPTNFGTRTSKKSCRETFDPARLDTFTFNPSDSRLYIYAITEYGHPTRGLALLAPSAETQGPYSNIDARRHTIPGTIAGVIT